MENYYGKAVKSPEHRKDDFQITLFLTERAPKSVDSVSQKFPIFLQYFAESTTSSTYGEHECQQNCDRMYEVRVT
jgi:hypothetical protein